MAQVKAPQTKEPPKNAKLWVVGPTDYNNPLRIANVMERYRENHGISLIITGGDPGCEQLVEEWCRKSEIAYHGLPAIRSKDGDGAIPKRNKLIVDEEKPDALIVFVGGKEFDSAVRLA